MSPRMVLLGMLIFAKTTLAGEFVRIDPDSRALQTSLVTYTHPSGAKVILAATVHIADADYYAAISTQFSQSDSVILEGIIRRPRSTLDLRDGFSMFGLVPQQKSLRLGGVPSVAGDLTEDAFDRVRGKMPLAEVPASRLAFAGQIIDADQNPLTRELADSAFAIPQRNSAAIDALRHRLARGDRAVTLVYGVAHGNDLEKRLCDQLGFARSSSTWLKAFSY